MKSLSLFTASLLFALQLSAQTNVEMQKHFRAYYKQMKAQGDVQGVINALTHLTIIDNNKMLKDTLAGYYMNNGKHVQALNVIGYDIDANDSNLAVEVKAISLQALGETKRALSHYEILFKRKPNTLIAYEIADLKIQLNDITGATEVIKYGLNNSNDDTKRSYFENRAKPYQVPIKAAFKYLEGLVKFREDRNHNIDKALVYFDEALAIAPNFALVSLTKQALLDQKGVLKSDK